MNYQTRNRRLSVFNDSMCVTSCKRSRISYLPARLGIERRSIQDNFTFFTGSQFSYFAFASNNAYYFCIVDSSACIAGKLVATTLRSFSVDRPYLAGCLGRFAFSSSLNLFESGIERSSKVFLTQRKAALFQSDSD